MKGQRPFRLWASGSALALLLGCAPVLADGSAPEPCGAKQAVVFACTMARGKRLSLCGSPPATLQYRFGSPSRADLIFPGAAAEGASRMRFAHYHRYQVERSEVVFDNAGVAYTVFDETRSGVRRAGVSVQGAGQAREQILMCRGHVVGTLSALKPHLPCDADSALQGGTCR